MKAWMDKLRGFWARRGFYLLAAACIALIALAAVYARGRLFPAAPPRAAQVEAVREASGDAAPAPSAGALPTPAATPAPALGWPVSGREILRDYAGEPVWFEPLGVFETHPGVDIRAAEGEAVLAAADGLVWAAGYDPQRGYMVETRDGDLVVRYGNLRKGPAVRVGERVRKGQRIGWAGASAPGTDALGFFVHFEAFRGGERIALP